MTNRNELDERLSEEIRFHIEQQTEKNLRAGMTADEARRAAHLQFGGVESTREYTRDQFRWAWLSDFARDLKVALRMWKRTRGATVVAILTLAIGIGANTAMFSLLNALILNPLPYPDTNRLVSIWDSSERNPRNEVSYANYADWKAQQKTFESLGLYRWWTANLTDDQNPERVQGFQLTSEILPALGLKPYLGRWFTAAENQPGGERVVLLSHGLWQRRFGGNPAVLGTTIMANGVAREVIGVLRPEQNFPPGAEIIAPFQITPDVAASRKYHSYYVVGRLKAGVSVQEANADIGTIAARLARQYPDSNKDLSARVFPLVSDVAHEYSNGVWLLMASVGFVLLIACANLANVLLARAPARAREIAVRTSMGASRGRIVRQIVAESLALALVGGALGAGLAMFVVRVLRETAPADLLVSVPGLATLGVNGAVLAFTFALSIATGLFFGLVPALRTSRVNLSASLRDAGRPLGAASGNRLRSALVAAEVALALTLLSGAGFTMKSFSRLTAMDTGFDPTNTLTMGVTLPYAIYQDEAVQARFFSDLLARAAATHGVERAGLTSNVPLAPGNSTDGIVIEGRPAPTQEPEAAYRVVSAGYFETIGAHVARGRAFATTDTTASPLVMVVNETFANRFFQGADPIGHRIRFSGPPDKTPWREVVGVVKDIRHDLNHAPQPETYIPFTQGTLGTMFLVTKTRDDAMGMAPALRAAVLAIDPNQPVWAVNTLQGIKDRSMAGFRALATFISAFSTVALLLSAVGIFGVVSFAVSTRTPEIGLRMALGARQGDVVRLIAAQNATPLVVGFIVGGVGSFAVGRVLTSAFPEVATADPQALLVTATILAIVASLATWLPARRAAAIAPTDALRSE